MQLSPGFAKMKFAEDRKMNSKELEQLVMFSIFMENGEGIMSKAPDYIMKKWRRCRAGNGFNGLDDANQAKFKAWISRWKFAYDSEASAD